MAPATMLSSWSFASTMLTERSLTFSDRRPITIFGVLCHNDVQGSGQIGSFCSEISGSKDSRLEAHESAVQEG